ncbi:peptidoglycan DD-metalloendopeptidase family protein [Bacillus sp. CH30_1T]|uniref:peptidoglycan DD-metalloendopeptidase family protein n=1 Tax=Bacillus sp. CH30_1T TaxID=2604836 RepID=UPI00165E278C|nr:peptidoglycan DD-metalloendopeptidase family protein [Bacillus sp. CH30_1T]
MFIYPTQGKITSRFGKDFLNGVARMHNGIDIAKSGLNEVVASERGKVSKSYLSSSYGECVRIAHEINGQTWESLYAHMRTGSRKVSEGDYVKQGQPIGIMGNTGYSFGQHLHFELHKGRWDIKKSKAVNPLDYLLKDLSSPSSSSVHTVKSGDTLWEIAKDNNLSVSELKALNGLKSDVIYPGDNLTLKNSSYVGKRAECRVSKLRFYSKPSWDDKFVVDYLTEGYGFPTIVRKLKVDDAYQFEVENSKGKTFFVTANEKYIRVE